LRTLPATSLLALAASLAWTLPPSALAQDAPPPAPAEPAPAGDTAAPPPATESQIIVTGQSLRGTVDAPQPPVLELNEADIAAYGAGSISELIQALSPATGGGSGRGGGFPVILVNGVRISSFRELQSYPPESIDKVEVLAAETAQQFGYGPDERVVNIILKRAYASREIELEYGQPWDGGYSTQQAEATYLQIAGQSRYNFELGWENQSLLTEAERGVIQSSPPAFATDPDPALYRSLIADTAGLEANGNFTTKLGARTSLSVNAAFERNDSLRLQGLNTVFLAGPGGTALRTLGEEDPLTVDNRTTTYSAGTTIDTRLGDWQITGTADGNHVVSRSLIDRRADVSGLAAAAAAGTLALDADLPALPDAGFDRADSKTDTLNSLVTAVGRPLELPAGEVTVTLDTGYNFTRIESEDTRRPGLTTSLKRGDLSAGVNVGIPLTSRREEFGEEIGDLSLNLQAGINELSDFGTLTDWTVGLNWGITERLNFNVSYVARDAAPSLGQLGNPEIQTFNVPLFDLTRNETVLATTISGGNPFLPAQSQRDWRLGVNWQLPEFTSAIQQGRLDLQFFKNHSEDVAAGFPFLTPTIEAAFPGRVTRQVCGPADPVTCVDGRLVSIDQRPVTFAQQDSTRLQVGLFFTGPFGKARPQAAAQQANNPLQQIFRPQGGVGQAGQSQGQGGAFNREAFERVRARFCTPEAANTVPTAADLEGLPQRMLDRVKNPDGTVNPERWAEARGGICDGEGRGGPRMDPERLAQLREQFCPKPGEQAPPITDEQLAALPPQMLERLKGPDGKVDPERVNQMRAQFCSGDQPAQGGGGQRGQGDGRRGGGGQGGGGPVIIQAGPGGGPGGPGGGGGRGGGGGFRGGGGQSADGRGRWFFNLNYNYLFENEVLIAQGGPLLDLLDGDATSGTQPRHQGQFNGGLFYAGFGTQVNARYVGSSRIDGSGLPGSTDLFFDDYFTFNMRVFADLQQRTKLIEDVPLLKNTRITFAVNNVFDARQRVTDSTGAVPLRYQPFLIDPVGRFFEIELRKLF
jgi:iron complex outermembrane receptor protein